MPTIGEANDLNRFMCFLFGYVHNGMPIPTREQAKELLAGLADRCNKTLSAGLTGNDVRRLWDERQPEPAWTTKPAGPVPAGDGLTVTEFVDMVAPTVGARCQDVLAECEEVGDHICEDQILRCARHCTCPVDDDDEGGPR